MSRVPYIQLAASVQYGGTSRIASVQYGGTSRIASVQYGGTSRIASVQYGGTSRIASVQYGGTSRIRDVPPYWTLGNYMAGSRLSPEVVLYCKDHVPHAPCTPATPVLQSTTATCETMTPCTVTQDSPPALNHMIQSLVCFQWESHQSTQTAEVACCF